MYAIPKKSGLTESACWKNFRVFFQARFYKQTYSYITVLIASLFKRPISPFRVQSDSLFRSSFKWVSDGSLSTDAHALISACP